MELERWRLGRMLSPAAVVPSLAASAALFLFYLVAGIGSPRLDEPWRIDEGQRIAEGYSWRLLRAGDVTSPDWFRTIAFRSHPPVSKYFYGAAAELAGREPPRNLDLARAYDAGAGAGNMPARYAPEYLPLRRPARLASFLINISTAILIFAVLLRLQGFLPAALSQLLLLRHYLFGEALYYARSDTVQTFFLTATIAALLCLPKRAGIACAALAGLSAALAFQTRLNGGVALLMGLAFIAALGVARIRFAVSLVAAFSVVSIVINPYYWAVPRFAPDVPASVMQHRWLLPRIVSRLVLQVRELGILLAGVGPEWHLTSIASRLRFTASVLFSGTAGLAIAIGLLLVLIMLKQMPPAERATVAWSLTGIIVIAVWIPLRWDMYLLLIVPPAVIAACAGYGAALRRVL